MTEMQWVHLDIAYPLRWWNPEDTPTDAAPWFVRMFNDLSFELNDCSAYGEMAVFGGGGEFNYGTSQDDLNNFLCDLRADKIPFICRTDAKYELPSEWELFDGESGFSGIGSEQALLDQSTWAAISSGLSHFASVDAYFAVGNKSADSLSIAHLTGDIETEAPDDRDVAARIADNIINGNLSDARKQLEGAPPLVVLDVVQNLHDAHEGWARAVGQVAMVLNGQQD